MINQNFISIYDDILSKEYCDIIINEFESKLDRHHKGRVGSNKVKPETKKKMEQILNTGNRAQVMKFLNVIFK